MPVSWTPPGPERPTALSGREPPPSNHGDSYGHEAPHHLLQHSCQVNAIQPWVFSVSINQLRKIALCTLINLRQPMSLCIDVKAAETCIPVNQNDTLLSDSSRRQAPSQGPSRDHSCSNHPDSRVSPPRHTDLLEPSPNARKFTSFG